MNMISKNEVLDAFAEAEACAGAPNCKRVAEAMCKFYLLNNRQVAENNNGLIVFASEPPEVCSNRDQLFCQDV